MYYWDTYFTNVGLIIDGKVEQAKYNCENMLHLVERFGFMLNGNRTWFLDRSQPPYLSMMIRDVYEETKDLNWLKHCLPALEKEYAFWMNKRIATIGLNHFSNSATYQDKLQSFRGGVIRLGLKLDTINQPEATKISIGSHFLSECESGWDFNPRFDNRCADFCPIDLNCNLYMYEKNFAFFYTLLNNADSVKWEKLAAKRKILINSFLFDSNSGLFYDYDFVNKKHSRIYSAAVFNTLWSGIANSEQTKAILENLSKLEFSYGISACEPGKREVAYQWDYPNAWPCIQYLAVKGLLMNGFHEEAERIAVKFIKTATMNFEKTNNLWEKYNVSDGSIKVYNEYEMPAMMGWTAGVFAFMSDYISKKL